MNVEGFNTLATVSDCVTREDDEISDVDSGNDVPAYGNLIGNHNWGLSLKLKVCSFDTILRHLCAIVRNLVLFTQPAHLEENDKWAFHQNCRREIIWLALRVE